MLLKEIRLRQLPNSRKSAAITAALVIGFELFNAISVALGLSSSALNNKAMMFAALAAFIALNFPRGKSVRDFIDIRIAVMSCLFALSSYYFWESFPVRYKMLLIFGISYLFLLSLKAYVLQAGQSRADCSPRFVFLISFAVSLACLLLMWTSHFPYSTSPDTIRQWDELHGAAPYNDAFTAGYVIYLKLLLRIIDSYGIVILSNILLASLLYASFSKYLSRHGVSVSYLIALPALICGFSCTQAYFYAWKDVPFSLCIGVVTLYLMKMNDADFRISYHESVFLGICTAFCYLFRHNGIVVSAFAIAVFFAMMRRRNWIRKFAVMLLTSLVCVVSVNLYSDKVLKPEGMISGTEFWPMMTGIAAAVSEGNVTDAQLAEISRYYDIDFMRSNYNVYNKLALITDGICYDHHDGYYCMANYAPETVKLYFKLLPGNVRAMAADFLGNAMVVLGTVTFAFYEHHIVYMLTLLYLAMLYHRKKGRHRAQLSCLVPIILNAATIMAAVISYEQRYVLATFMLFPFIAAYIVMRIREQGDGSGRHAETGAAAGS